MKLSYNNNNIMSEKLIKWKNNIDKSLIKSINLEIGGDIVSSQAPCIKCGNVMKHDFYWNKEQPMFNTKADQIKNLNMICLNCLKVQNVDLKCTSKNKEQN